MDNLIQDDNELQTRVQSFLNSINSGRVTAAKVQETIDNWYRLGHITDKQWAKMTSMLP